jgi:cell division protein FtsB
MNTLSFVLAGLLLALQYPLWIGKGSWMKVRELDRSLAEQREGNARLKARNDALDAEVRDLKTGFEAIEERARAELGMVKQDEVFFQLQQPSRPSTEVTTAASSAAMSLPIRPAAPSGEKR